MTTPVDLQAALEEVLKWKKLVALPAIEELKNLKTKLDFYINQEILYQSQIEMLQEELANQVSTSLPTPIDEQDENDEVKMPDQCTFPKHNPSNSNSRLSQVSRADSFIFEKLYNMEYMRESSQSLNLEIENLQKINQELQDENENYVQVNNRMHMQQTASNEKIADLYSNVDELCKELSHVTKGETDEPIEETPLTVAIPADYTSRKSIDFTNDLLVQQTVTFFSPAASDVPSTGVLSISRTTSVKAGDITSLFDTNDKREMLSIKAVAVRGFGSGEETEGKYTEEIEMVDEKNAYDVEIEGLNLRLVKYKIELSGMKHKYNHCDKELSELKILYDKLYAEMQELNTNNGSFFKFC